MADPVGPHRRWRPLIVCVPAVGLDLVLFSTLLNSRLSAGTPAALVVAYAVVGGVILYWQGYSPRAGYAALWLHALGSMVLSDYRPTLPLLVGLYVVAARAPRRSALLALLATVGPIAVAVLAGVREAPPGEQLATFTGLATLLLLLHSGVFGVGLWAGAVRDRTRRLELAPSSAARAAIEDERARISGELHDIVAHSVTIMTLLAAGARKVMHQDPMRAEDALTQVDGAGVQAMSELRRMLAALRPDEGSGRLAELDQLVSRVRAVGVDVTVRHHGRTAACPVPVDVVAYHVIQEALTNAAKHAGPGAHANVDLRWRPRHVVIEIRDDGDGDATVMGAALSTGNGLRGLASRVAALGGTLDAGPAAGGGFRMRARLPLAANGPPPRPLVR